MATWPAKRTHARKVLDRLLHRQMSDPLDPHLRHRDFGGLSREQVARAVDTLTRMGWQIGTLHEYWMIEEQPNDPHN